jgi:uncharacterized membrane protein
MVARALRARSAAAELRFNRATAHLHRRMSPAFAHRPWPAPVAARAESRWRFAQELPPRRDGGALAALQWRMARHTSFAPGRLLRIFAALCLFSLGIGVAFWGLGAPAVLPLAGAELLLLGTAFWVWSRHAGDAETLTLAERELRVEHRCGRQVERGAFRAEWVRVEPVHGEGSLLELTGQGQRMRVGRYIRPELRTALARELRHALRRECALSAGEQMHWEQQR